MARTTEGTQIATFAGAPVIVTKGFLVTSVVLYLVSGTALPGLLGMLLWLPAVAMSVLVHEAGHALVARANHQRIREIALTWHGGHVVREGLPLPAVDLRVALAGPAASLGLAAVSLVASFLPLGIFASVAWMLFWLNLSWGLFNLLPFPSFDGGHAVAALTRMGRG